jgi:L-threonylcarbamoyladenylate synthase
MFSPQAVSRIFQAKQRPNDNPLIVHIAHMDMLPSVAALDITSQWTATIHKQAMALCNAFWPGPLTILFQRSKFIAHSTAAGLATVGVRFPSHPIAIRLIQLAGIFNLKEKEEKRRERRGGRGRTIKIN